MPRRQIALAPDTRDLTEPGTLAVWGNLPEVDKATHDLLEKERAEVESFLPTFRAASIATDADLAIANRFVQQAKDRRAKIEEKRKSITVPIDTAKRKVQDIFNPVLKAYDAAEEIWKGHIGSYTLAKRRADDARMQAVAESIASGDTDTARAIVSTMASSVEPKGLSVKERWIAEVTDESAVPREFMCVDMLKLSVLIPKEGRPIDVPGITWVTEADVRIRRTR